MEDGPLAQRLVERIRREGPVPFDAVMSSALYDEHEGFYTSGAGRAGGRRGDFLTSPEVGPLFGAVVARGLVEHWEALGRPEPFVVVESAAGRGALARAVVDAAPPFVDALEWHLVERSPALRAAQAELIPVSLVADAATPRAGPASSVPSHWRGVRVCSWGGLADVRAAAGPLRGVVLANELLDNLPVRLARRREVGWDELGVDLGDGGAARFRLASRGPLDDTTASHLDRLAPDARRGAVVPIAAAARRWVAAALGLLGEGAVIVFDYGDTTGSLASRPLDEWLRSYRAHERAGDPLSGLGSKDVTCEVPVDQLDDPPPSVHERQADHLRRHGIDGLVEEGRRVWAERAHLGDLAALRARSRVREAEALCDAAGLGSFHVLSWHRSPDPRPDLTA